MSANLCVESHRRERLEQGFEVAVVKDATAAAITPELRPGDQPRDLDLFLGFLPQALLDRLAHPGRVPVKAESRIGSARNDRNDPP